MCERCGELKRKVRSLQDENLVLRQRVQVLNLTIDTLKADGQDMHFFTSEQVAGLLQSQLSQSRTISNPAG